MPPEAGAAGGQAAGGTGAGGQAAQGQGSGGAGAGSNGAGAGTGGAGTGTTDWTTGFSDELKGYVSSKGFKDPASVVDSYRNYEKLQGVPADRLLKMPEKDDDPAWGDIYTRLGKPLDAKNYNIEVPKEFGDEKLADFMKGTFHKANLSSKQAELVTKNWNEYVGNQIKENQEATNIARENDTKSLKKEWGAAFDANIAQGRKAALALGIKGEMIDKLEEAMGFAGVMKFMHNLGTKVGEDNFIDGDTRQGFSGALTPDQAKNKLAMLKADPEWTRRYLNGEAKETEEMERLQRQSYPDLDA